MPEAEAEKEAKMDWKEKALNDLRKYTEYKASVKALEATIRDLRSDMASITPPQLGSAPARTNISRRDDVIASSLDEILRCEKAIKSRKRLINRVEAGISVLSDHDRRIIQSFFFGRSKSYQIEADLYTSHASIYRHRNRAIKAYAVAVGYRK